MVFNEYRLFQSIQQCLSLAIVELPYQALKDFEFAYSYLLAICLSKVLGLEHSQEQRVPCQKYVLIGMYIY